jgi:hypothetical protein
MLAFANLARLLVEAALANLGEYPIFLDRLLEAPQNALE